MARPKRLDEELEEAKRLEQQMMENPEPKSIETEEPEQSKMPQDPQESEPEESWEQKYRVLKGKYDAEVPSLQHQVKRLDEELSFMRNYIQENLKARPEEEAKPSTSSDPNKYVSQDDLNNYGADYADFIAKVARGVVESILPANLEKDLAKIKTTLNNIGGRVDKTVQRGFWDELGELVPDWQRLNYDQDFLAWLATPNPESGHAREALLHQAQADGDAKRVANIFNAYKRENGIEVKSARNETAVASQSNPSVERQISPRASRAVGSTTAESKRNFRANDWKSEIDKITDLKIRGKITETEYRKRMDALAGALAQGQVRP